ncbi:hypothetical protein B0A48_05380 [Cryoendolithus antarcticus]|uniref:Zf-UBP-domain-containing protein n=1 Tax=Cryoendolithus antarcticus TaxID=1507870 RepID=A0A1V8TIB8_9PEZI|nr:hypothetical protein B0A48_05380 [Cryoendolithus antarcticus]
MPPYFFHLKLELYPTPTIVALGSRSPTSKVFVPTSSTDVFKTPLPAHRSSTWASYSFPKRPASAEAISNSPSSRTSSETHGDALLLPERSLNHRSPSRTNLAAGSPALTPTRLSHAEAARDWRYSQVEIESIDMEEMSQTTAGRSKSSAAGGLHTKALYLPSDPKTTELGWGVVHLYRDLEEGDGHDTEGQTLPGLTKKLSVKDDFDPDECTTLCILAVPSWMMPSDLLGFVGDQAREDVSHFRLIRTGRANKYMVLLKFRTPKKAREWQKVYNGRLFSAAEPENCHVVFIKSVEFLTPESSSTDLGSFPQNTHDPFTPSSNKSLTSKPHAPPPPNLLELPTCPVCLERMDETTGLLTILCQHVFHCACLEKWRGSGCPVCRYTHSPSYTFPYPRPSYTEDDDSEPMCSVCASTTNIWVCLICGSLGCGRYDSAHAYAHYESTSHCYAMDISTQHVWDYAGDGYVHRLIQSKPDSRLIDLPSSARQRHENEAFRSEGGEMVPREKMESMAAEYTYLLTSQLEGQRRYFEEQVERAVGKAEIAGQRAEEAGRKAVMAASSAEERDTERAEHSAVLARLETSLAKSEAARKRFETMARDFSAQLREEKTMNQGLLERIKVSEQKAESAKAEGEKIRAEKADLEEMNHDLTSFISAQEKVKELQEAGEEVEEGGIGVVENKGKKGKGRKKGA